jgi:predicted small metal-binding protein
MDSFKPSILEYLGKISGGILVLIGLMYENKVYECTYFYTDKDIVFTIPDELEEVVGDITKHPEYPNIIREILKRIVPHSQMMDSIDPVDFSKWINGVINIQKEYGIPLIPESRIKEIKNNIK